MFAVSLVKGLRVPLALAESPPTTRDSTALQFIDQLHDGSDAGVEMPSSLEVITDPLDSLVQLTWTARACGLKVPAPTGSSRVVRNARAYRER